MSGHRNSPSLRGGGVRVAIRTLVQEDQTIEDVAAQIQMTPGEIRNFIRTDTMIQLAHVAAPASREKIDDKAFSVTTLERLIQSEVGRKFLGIKFDEDGNAVGEYDPEEFKKAYGRIVADIAEEKINTRALNTNDDIDKYLGKLGKDKPDKPKKATWTSTQLLSGKTKAASAALKVAKKPKPTEPSERTEACLIPRSFRCRINHPRIKEIYTELRRLKLIEYPNACAVLGRIFVELLIGHYLEKTGKDKPLLDKAKKEGRKEDWSPTLRQMMRAILNDTTITITPQARRAVDKMTNDDTSLISLEQIDQFVHNRYIAPNERVLRQFWTAVEPLLEMCMTELVALAAKPKK